MAGERRHQPRSSGRRGDLGRRQFLHLAAAGLPGLTAWSSLACSSSPGQPESPLAATAGSSPLGAQATPVLAPRVNGGINVHPLRTLEAATGPGDLTIVPELVALQLESVYELGFDGLRITAPFGDRANFLAAIPYVRAARAIGIDAVVVLSEFAGLELPRALYDDGRRERALRLYASVFGPPPEPVRPDLGGLGPRGVGRIAFQILNEPAHFFGVPPDVYVHDFLTPCFVSLKASHPEIIVVSAAEVGNSAGPARMRAMLEAGLERSVDRIAYHIYDRSIIGELSSHVRSIVWVTESGSAGTASHLPWVRDVFPEIRARITDSLRIFYYDLYDPGPGAYRLLDIRREGDAYRKLVESADLHAHFTQNVLAAARGPILDFASLIPEIRAYFPTANDVAAYDEGHDS
jgi:hypothetical protein